MLLLKCFDLNKKTIEDVGDSNTERFHLITLISIYLFIMLIILVI